MIFISFCAFSILWYTILIEEKPAWDSFAVKKWMSILLDFSGNHGCTSLMSHEIQQGEISLNLIAVWILIQYNELFILSHCDPLVYLVIWIYLLPMHGFGASCTGHLKNIGSENHADHPNVDTISRRSHLLMFSPISLEQYLTIGKLSNSWWWIQVSQNFNVCLKSEILVLSTKIFNCFPRSDRFPSFFSRKYLPNTQVWV